MPKRLLDGTTRVDFLALADKPVDLAAITVTELATAVPMSCAIVKDGFKLGYTASDTVSQPALCETTNTSAPDTSNFDCNFGIFRYRDADGKVSTAEDTAFAAVGTKGTEGWMIKRRGPKAGVAWAAADVYTAFPVVLDNPQDPDDTKGYDRVQVIGLPNGDPIEGVVAAGV